MRKIIIGAIVVGLLIVGACSVNPFTGKSTMALVSNSELFPMSFQEYNSFLSEHAVVTNTEDARMVERVGINIANAADKWLKANGYPNYLDDYKWEFKLVQDDQVNAWCMPGGKIVFYTGILPIAQNEAGVAAIMGHEVAHALSNHGQQRMSAAQYQSLLGAVGSAALSNNAKYQQVFEQAYGVGSNVGVMLPFSRNHESEADKIGLTLMAIAGYEPIEAAHLWERMAQVGGQSPPEILSTHPSNQTRIQNIIQWAPEAKREASKYK
ncbi:MAG TPA: M48 family metallopeptidase [Flavobacteriaceae bacterium]|nr:M48 family metallopeptidase [Flavobacteriaceae bacterium]